MRLQSVIELYLKNMINECRYKANESLYNSQNNEYKMFSYYNEVQFHSPLLIVCLKTFARDTESNNE